MRGRNARKAFALEIRRHDGVRIRAAGIDDSEPDLAGRQPAADAGEARRQVALEAFLGKRSAVAQQAQADVPVEHDFLAGARISRRPGEGRRERIACRCRANEYRKCENPPSHTSSIPWFLSGTSRRRLPVALKKAFITAGAATQMVGSPMPPHTLPPPWMMIVSTFGIWAMRIDGKVWKLSSAMRPSLTVFSCMNSADRP